MKKGLKIGVFIIVSVLGSLVGRKIKNLCTRPVFLTLSSSPSLALLSPEVQNHLRSFISQQRTSFDASSVCACLLKNSFPVLKNVKLSFKHGRFLVYAQVAKPLLIINDQYVVTDTQRFVERTCWSDAALIDVPRVTVADHTTLSLSSLKALTRLSYGLKDAYHISWIDDSLVKFYDPAYPRATLIGNAATQPEQLCNSRCAQLKSEIMKKKTSRKGPNDWCIDVRFKNQMIVFPGGRA